MKCQELMAEKETQKPYTDTAVQERVPRYLEFAEPTDGRTIFFDVQVRGSLNAHIKQNQPAGNLNVLVFFVWLKRISDMLHR